MMRPGKSRPAMALALGLLVTLLISSCQVPPPVPIPTPLRFEPTARPVPTVTTLPPTPTAVPDIKVGALFDLSGATSQVSAPYVDAVRQYIRTVNEQGGVGGRKVTLIEIDYGYQVPRAVDAYKRLLAEDKVVAILGWASPDTEALSPLVAQDKIPYLSASYAGSLVDPTAQHPYNFLLGATYSDQMRVVLKYLKDNWKDAARKPRVAFLFADNALGRSPMAVARGAIGQLEMEVADEQALPLDAEDATSQLSSIRAKGAEFIVVNNLTPATAVAVKDAAKLGLKARIATLNWGVDEDLIKRAGVAAEGVIGVTPFSFLGEGRSGFDDLIAAYKTRGTDTGQLTSRHVQGWLTAKFMLEGIRRAGTVVTGETIRSGLETLREFDTGGITAAITFTKDDHAGSKQVRLYQVQDGRWMPIGDFVRAERR